MMTVQGKQERRCDRRNRSGCADLRSHCVPPQRRTGRNHRAGASARAKRVRRPRGDLRSRCEISRPKTTGPAPRGAARNRDPEEARRSRRRLPDLCSGRRRDRSVLRRHCADLEHARLLNAVVRPAGRRPRHGLRPPATSTSAGAPYTTNASSMTARSIRSRFRKAARQQPVASRSVRGKAGQRAAGSSTARRFSLRCGPCRLLRRALHRDRGGREGLAAQHALSRITGQRGWNIRCRRLGSAWNAGHGRVRSCSSTYSCRKTWR